MATTQAAGGEPPVHKLDRDIFGTTDAFTPTAKVAAANGITTVADTRNRV